MFQTRRKQYVNPNPVSKGEVIMRLRYVNQRIRHSSRPSPCFLNERAKLEKQLEVML